MSASTIITLGYGSFGAPRFIISLGYGFGAAPPPVITTTQVGGAADINNEERRRRDNAYLRILLLSM